MNWHRLFRPVGCVVLMYLEVNKTFILFWKKKKSSCIVDKASTSGVTVAPQADRRNARSDYNIPMDLFPENNLGTDELREMRRREERIKSIMEGIIGDTRIITQDKARLLGELIGEVVSKCIRETDVSATNVDKAMEPSMIDGIVLPLGGAIARIFLERPPPADSMAERHLDFDLGANTFMRINSMQNSSTVRFLIGQVHWEAFARYGVKLLGNTISREEYLDAVGFSTGLTMSLMQQINGTVLKQDVVTTAKKYVGNFLKAHLLMNNQYYSFMDHTISWLADDIALYVADDVLRIRVPAGSSNVREEWKKYAAEANKGLRNLRLISVGLLLSYRSGPNDLKFLAAEVLGQMVPPSWMSLKYSFPAV